jgi:hypothetical protein
MIFTIAILIAAAGALMFYRARSAGRVNRANLGWVSASWLTEYRASCQS